MPFVRCVVVANPLQVRSIAWAKVKTDKIDACLLAKVHASGFLPEVFEAVISYMKGEGHLGRCYLKGREGDAANATLAAVGHNLRLV
jgi:hypothetical protein